MRAEVIAVGTELLLGDIANTNAQTIGRALASIGVDCLVHTAVGDNEERIAEAISATLARADAAIVTGGLGPTQDDVTREAIARVAGCSLRRDPQLEREIRARFEAMRRAMPDSNLRQADVPEGAHPIPNPLGTAPGLRMQIGTGVVYALPGVPHEMVAMLEAAVLADLSARAGAPARIVSRVVRTSGMAESAVADALRPLWDRMAGGVTMAFLAGGGEVRVRLTAKAPDASGAAALLDEAEREVRAVLGGAVFGADDETLEAVCGALLGSRGWRLAVAESLTGGMISARITAVAGASAYYAGSIVAYEPAAKVGALGVDAALIEREGVVSAAVARAMARGARRSLQADVGLAVTGVAGPAPLGAPVGTVHLAVAGPDGAASRALLLPGGRQGVRSLATGAALNLLRLYLAGEIHDMEPETS